MGIDIHVRNEKRNRLFTITDDLYDILDKALIDAFEKRTGVFLDNFGTTRLSFQHTAIFIQLLKKAMEQKEIPSIKPVTDLIRLLDNTVKEKVDLDFVGD